MTPPAGSGLGVSDVRAAADLLAGIVDRTPTAVARALSELAGGPVYLKCENLQRTGSFKVRGAYVRIARLTEAERARGVVAASAGNHAQGVALAAALLYCRATVFMPQNASLPKVAATASHGADVRLGGDTVEDALAAATAFADETGAVLIHPFDHHDVIAGQGTVGLEIIEQVPDVRTIVTCVGGGGLMAGLAVAAKGIDPTIAIVGVQAEAVAGVKASLDAGHVVAVTPAPTIADGIAIARPGEVPFSYIQALADRVVTVAEPELAQGLLHALERYKVLVEPSAAAPIAALLRDPQAFEPPVVVVLSGGNVDPLLLSRILRMGLATSGRFLSLRLRLRDRPGSLAAVLDHCARLGANLVTVEHHRLDPRLGVDEVTVDVQLETRGPAHCADLVGELRALGYRVEQDQD